MKLQIIDNFSRAVFKSSTKIPYMGIKATSRVPDLFSLEDKVNYGNNN